jgi:uncharacterized protein YcbK (DUF882 family)
MRALVTLLFCIATCSAVAQEMRNAASFAVWREQNAAAVADFQSHLQSAELDSVVPIDELLRTASDWQTCQAQPYAVPPRDQWPSVVSVLQLLKTLTTQQILGPFVVHSAYRDPELNKCAGGAPKSAHLRAFAVDFVPVTDSTDEVTKKLCRFWREHGRQWRMGFSRYPSGRMHIDTAGYRTWGVDHSGKSAVCGA